MKILSIELSYKCCLNVSRHGTEPVVNLTYSDKGSTASRISLSVGDEMNREAVPPQGKLSSAFVACSVRCSTFKF